MKKFVIITLVVAMVAGTAFAQDAGISLGGWGRGFFAPLQVVGPEKDRNDKNGNDGDGDSYGAKAKVLNSKGDLVDEKAKAYTGTGVTWGGPVRVGFSVNGNSEFIGFGADITAEGGVGMGDNVYIWAKPFSSDILKLSIGRFFKDDLRGKIAIDSGFENFVAGGMDEDNTFNRFSNTNGFMLSSEPIEGLFIGLKVYGDAFVRAIDAYRFMQFGVGYTIADIGQFRVQYVGGWFGTFNNSKFESRIDKELDPNPWDVDEDEGTWGFNDKTTNEDADWEDILKWTGNEAGSTSVNSSDLASIQAAFALTAIENLLVDIGIKFGLPLTLGEGDAAIKYSKGVHIGLDARYRLDAFQIVLKTGTDFGGYVRGKDSKATNGFGLDVNLEPSYDLEAFTIGASLGGRFRFSGKNADGNRIDDGYNKENTATFGFGGYAKKGFSNGYVKAGLAYATRTLTSTYVKDGDPAKISGAVGQGVFTIPVILEYWF